MPTTWRAALAALRAAGFNNAQIAEWVGTSGGARQVRRWVHRLEGTGGTVPLGVYQRRLIAVAAARAPAEPAAPVSAVA